MDNVLNGTQSGLRITKEDDMTRKELFLLVAALAVVVIALTLAL